MEEVKNVVSVTLTKKDFEDLFNPLVDSIMDLKDLSESGKLHLSLSAIIIHKELSKLLFGD